MATTYYAQANFKTGYLQRELLINIAPKATATAHVGDVFHIDSNGELEARSSNVSAAAAKATVAVGDYILAQSDMTLGNGHVPVENRDYAYSDVVATTDSTARNFAVFKITNLDDVNLTTRSITT